MYLPEEDAEAGVLRQGDIIEDVPLLGAISLDKHVAIDTAAWSVAEKPERGLCMVLSHSCEIDPQNTVKVTSLILAPVRDAARATEPAKFEILKSSNILREGVTSSYLKYFYLEPHAKLPLARGGVVDFSKLFSLRKTAIEQLAPKKILQLKPDFAQAMAKKLAAYFFRM